MSVKSALLRPHGAGHIPLGSVSLPRGLESFLLSLPVLISSTFSLFSKDCNIFEVVLKVFLSGTSILSSLVNGKFPKNSYSWTFIYRTVVPVMTSGHGWLCKGKRSCGLKNFFIGFLQSVFQNEGINSLAQGLWSLETLPGISKREK